MKILETSAVRYSSPLIFNDPFDVQSGLHFDFDIESLPDKTLKRIEDLVVSDSKPSVCESDPMGKLVLLVWENKVTRDLLGGREWEAFRCLLAWLKERIVQFRGRYEQSWNNFLPRLRVFSVAEEEDNLLMWSHYGQAHTGVVFEFLVLPQEDNPLCVAQPVIYRNAPPSLFTEQQWMEEILGVQRLDLEELYFRYVYVKSAVWAYEKEWRVWDLLPEREEALYSDYPLRAKEIGSVYLGCKIAPDSKESILSLISKKHPDARIFQARKAADEFRVVFDAI